MPRKNWIPKNIATMTDDERYKWWCSLPDEVADRLVDRTFKAAPEWWVYVETKTEGRELMDTCETLADAQLSFKQFCDDPNTVAAEIEKVVGHYNVADGDLADRDYTTIATYGAFTGD